MNNQELMQKLLREENLAAEEQCRLDSLLSDSEPVKILVGTLPSEVPSMAWRSSLNEKLLLEASRGAPKRTALWLKLSPALAVAGVFVAIIMTSKPVTIAPVAQPIFIEEQLVQAHNEIVNTADSGMPTTDTFASNTDKSEIDSSVLEWSDGATDNL